MSKETKPYSYFDTPDGEDIVDKLIVVLKPTALSGLAISTIDVMLHSKPKGYLKTLGRYAYHTIPMLGISAAFVLTTNLVCSWRKKDDKLNWAAGGVAAGGVFGTWWGTPVSGFAAAAIFALIGVGKKHCVQNGYTIFPSELNIQSGGVLAPRHDFTLTKDNPGAWKVPKA